MSIPKNGKIHVLEHGNIYFFYRPKVASNEERPVEDLADVQRSYIVLSPHGTQFYRLVTIGQKQLPEIGAKQKSWGFVEKICCDANGIRSELGRKVYQTQTRGERIQPPARPAGEGIYAIVNHENHTHLAYALELPKDPGEVQHAMHIEKEGSYIISIKNPNQPSPPGVGLEPERKARFPEGLQQQFRGRRFIPANPSALLDYEGAEIIFIAASEDVSGELGLTLDPQEETKHTAEIFKDLCLEKSRHPLEPLFTGKWE